MPTPSVTSLLTVKKGREKPIRQRHPWIFSGAVAHVSGDPAPGDLVLVQSTQKEPLGSAFYNPHSQISGRMVSFEPGQVIDRELWRARLQQAYLGRALLALEPATNSYRLVYSEADNLPGLIVDYYAEFLVVQFSTMGMALIKEEIVALLAELPLPTGKTPLGILERSDAGVLQKEGLTDTSGHLWGDQPADTLSILENGLTFGVNLTAGHKTGFYLDQRDNRALFGNPSFVKDKAILNAFAYTGGFAAFAAQGGAASIVNLDTSIPALELAEQNVAANFTGRLNDEYLAGNAFEVLRDYRDNGRMFDAVVLDPPKFIHSQRDFKRGTRGYKDINWLAFRLLRPGGVLATFSCSGLVSPDLFQKIIFGAALDAGRDVQILGPLSQAADHPILLSFPESGYLKGLLCRVW